MVLGQPYYTQIFTREQATIFRFGGTNHGPTVVLSGMRKARELLDNHLTVGEPLVEEEVSAIVSAGLATMDDFDMTGGWSLLEEDE